MARRSSNAAHARWMPHVNRVGLVAGMHDWLVDTASLTLKLIACCGQFRVQRLHQERRRSLLDEFAAIELPRRVCVQEREVLLLCDGQPVVFAHTVVPLSATAHDWPFFSSLGERSLGTTLFGDPLVWRGEFEFARLAPNHVLARRARAVSGQREEVALLARRCLYRRKNSVLLVTEIFLPGIAGIDHGSATRVAMAV
jgi:chorismate--pyruvate lyase